MSTPEIDTDDDYLFEGLAMVTNRPNNSYLKYALVTPNQSDKSVTNGQRSRESHQQNQTPPLCTFSWTIIPHPTVFVTPLSFGTSAHPTEPYTSATMLTPYPQKN